MSKEILLVADALSHEKGLEQDIIFEAIEAALAMATKKRHARDIDVRVSINRKTGNYDTFRVWEIVINDDLLYPDRQINITEARQKNPKLGVGDTIEEQMKSIAFGRIAAQIAKQVINQRVRQAERLKVVEEYKARIGSLITGIVKRVSRDFAVIDLGQNTEAMLLREEMMPHEALRIGDRVRAYLYDVHFEPKGSQLFLSRTRLEMLVQLFTIEVPEIGEQLIEIKSAARDPGSRAKIAVKTNDGRIDPVGACVGMRGSRVQAVSGELCGERIDIVLWDDNPAQLVVNAMAPAEVESIIIDENSHSMDLVVKEEQLSQAIGKNGQNVRLATSLTGWTINLMTETEAEAKSAMEAERLQKMFMEKLGVDANIASILVQEGFMTLEEIAYVPEEELMNIEEFNAELVEQLRQRAKNSLEMQAEKSEVNAPAKDLLEMDGMTEEIARALAQHNIISREDLAEQSVDELSEIKILDQQKAAELIMKAREPWFK